MEPLFGWNLVVYDISCKLEEIGKNLIKEVIKQALESIMTAERIMFLKEHRRTKSGFYIRNFNTVLELKI